MARPPVLLFFLASINGGALPSNTTHTTRTADKRKKANMTKEQHQQGKSGRRNDELRTNELRTKANASNLHSFNSYFRKTQQASNHGLFRQFRLFRREQMNAAGRVSTLNPPALGTDQLVNLSVRVVFGVGGGRQVDAHGVARPVTYHCARKQEITKGGLSGESHTPPITKHTKRIH